MKWPETLTLVRHDESAYNRLKPLKAASPLYKSFEKEFKKDFNSSETIRLAKEVKEMFALNMADHNTPLAENAGHQAEKMASELKNYIKLPDVIFYSPYERTKETLNRMITGWPELQNIKSYEEERIREQEHGLALLYNDWKVFHALNPDEKVLYERQGLYWYRNPRGENVPDVRERLRSWMNTLTRDFAEQNVLAVTHHLTILGIRANQERMSAEEFIRIDREDKPINAGVTIYRGDPTQGKNGRLLLDVYNKRLY